MPRRATWNPILIYQWANDTLVKSWRLVRLVCKSTMDKWVCQLLGNMAKYERDFPSLRDRIMASDTTLESLAGHTTESQIDIHNGLASQYEGNMNRMKRLVKSIISS
ncbi:hypothetical protein HNQ57_002605 [Zhongshania antarctica]|uniref:Uncharacterized protein n=1 Tax=Zhongshania antarctica TaxID=641702 RepID=A0A840R764_9GAMM|nr:hypothetical protein [Zhongshania antarctica]